MATINVNGTPPGGGQPPGGGGKPPPSAAFQRLTGNPDYAKAIEQLSKRAADERAAYSQRDTQGAQAQARLNKVMQDEIRQRNEQLRQEQQREKDKRRRQEADDRADEALRRKKRADDNRAANQERAREVADAAHMDRARTQGQRQQRAFDFGDAMHMDRARSRGLNQQRAFEYGDAAAMNRAFNQNDYRVNNINRMGRMGQRFADTRSWKELAGIEHELKRIERVNERQLKFATSPAEQASLHRQENAILGARQRIAAGRSGNSGLMNGLGGVVGNIALLLDNPALKLATAAVSAAVTAPYALNKTYAGFLGLQKPYTDFRIESARLGRGGGFNGSDLANTILPSGAGSYIPRPGMGRSGEMQALGLGPQDVLRSLGSYGVPVRSARQGLDVAEQVRAAYLAPGMMLPEDQIAKMAGQARTMTAPNGDDQYLTKLQKIMSLATTQGLDSSRLASSWSGLMQSAASSSVSMNTQGMGDFFSRMVGSGAPNMRTGEGQISLMNDFNSSMSSLGTSSNMSGNVIMSSFLQHAGSPKDEESLRQALGVDKKQWQQMMSTPAAQNALQSYIGAMKQGDGVSAQRYLGVIVSSAGNPAGMTDTIMKTAGFNNLGYLQGIATSNFMGTSLPNALAMGSTLPGQGMSLGGVAPMAPADLIPMIAKKADELGIPINEAMALFAKESSFQSNAMVKGSSATGLGQVTRGTAAQFGYSQADMMDPEKNIDASLRYYKAQLDASGGNGAAAYEKYHYGPGSGKYDTSDAAQFNSLSGQYTNNKDVLPYLNKNADQQTANIKAAEYVSNVNDAVVAGFTKVADAAEHAAAALYKLGSMPGAVQRMPGGFMSPDGMWVPLTSQANGGALK